MQKKIKSFVKSIKNEADCCLLFYTDGFKIYCNITNGPIQYIGLNYRTKSNPFYYCMNPLQITLSITDFYNCLESRKLDLVVIKDCMDRIKVNGRELGAQVEKHFERTGPKLDRPSPTSGRNRGGGLRCSDLNVKSNYIRGEISMGDMNGYGILEDKTGFHYEGTMVNNDFEGQCKIKFANGDFYEGTISENRLNGEGKMIYQNGNCYTGDFVNDMKHGFGTFTAIDGFSYIGDYYLDKKHGNGQIIYDAVNDKIHRNKPLCHDDCICLAKFDNDRLCSSSSCGC